jgi:diacylglycerol O-acyltransferase
MTALDAAFLLLEDEEPDVSLAICSIAVFDGSPLSAEELTGMYADRVPRNPRYRQKVHSLPLDLGPPVWVDDEHFDLGQHLRRTALAAPGGDAELSALVGRLLSRRLDRSRPLWETWLVEGLAGGRWALVSTIHHCMADGVSGTDIYRAVLDEDPDARPSAAVEAWRPGPAPSTLALTADALVRLGALPVQQAGALAAALRHPVALVSQVAHAARGLRALPRQPVATSSLTGPLSAQRRFAFSRGSMTDVKAVRQAFGGTFNDVVLAAVAGAFRALLLSRGELPLRHSVRTLVPVNVRTAGEEGLRGNQVSFLLADLPVDVADPLERLALVRGRLAALKASDEASAVAALTALSGHVAYPLVAAAYRAAARLPQRSLTTVTTNVPGPQEQLYALGRPLRELIPYVPIASGMRTGVSIMTYRGGIAFGVTGDEDTSADVAPFALSIARSLDELVALAVLAAGRPAPAGAGRAG